MIKFKKIVVFDSIASRDFENLEIDVKNKFLDLIFTLEVKGRLEQPEGKKITNDLYEARVRHKNQWRGIYAYIKSNQIIILHIFVKKTQKIPTKDLKTALSRLKKYEQ